MKTYVTTCKICKWNKKGTIDELKASLHEVTTCAHCNGRQFRCPKCGRPTKTYAVKQNENN